MSQRSIRLLPLERKQAPNKTIPINTRLKNQILSVSSLKRYCTLLLLLCTVFAITATAESTTGSTSTDNTNSAFKSTDSSPLPNNNSQLGTTSNNINNEFNSVHASVAASKLSVNPPTDPCDAPTSGNLDSDGDGVADLCDLDDDNDGILDADENVCTPSPEFANMGWVPMFNIGGGLFNCPEGPDFTFSLTGHTSISIDSVAVFDDNTQSFESSYAQADNAKNITISANSCSGNTGDPITQFTEMEINFNQPTPIGGWAFAITDVDVSQIQIEAIDELGFQVPKEIINLWLQEVFDADPTNGGNNLPYWDETVGAIVGSADNDGFFNTNNIGLAVENETASAWFEANVSLTKLILTFSPISTNNDPSYHFYIVSNCCDTNQDTDNDGLVNRLDQDADNDGCSDAEEGGGSFSIAAGEITNDMLTGGVNAEGVPLIATPSGQTIGNSQDDSIQSCPCPFALGTDMDNDGTDDACDLDNDNDGIPDALEGRSCRNLAEWGVAPFLWTTSVEYGLIEDLIPGMNMEVDITTNAAGSFEAFGGTRLDGTNGTTTYFGGVNDLGVFFDPDPNQGTSPFNVVVTFSKPISSGSFLITDIDSGADRLEQVVVTTDIGNPALSLVSGSLVAISGNTASSANNVSSDDDTKGSILVTLPKGTSQVTIICNEMSNAVDPYSRGIGVLGKLTVCTFEDFDEDSVPDYLDTDSDDDGCPDALEGDGGFTFAQIQNEVLNGGVSLDGIPVVATAGGQGIGSAFDTQRKGLACMTSAENDINQTPQDVEVAGNVLTNDVDPTGNNQIVQQATGLDAAGNEVTIPIDNTPKPIFDADGISTGAIAIDKYGAYKFSPDPGYTGAIPIKYTVENENGTTANAKLDINVIGNPDRANNDLPIASNDTNTTPQETNVDGQLIISNDTDPDADPLGILAAFADTDGDGSVDNTLSIGATNTVYGVNEDGSTALAGSLALNIDGAYLFDPAIDFRGQLPIRYTIKDPSGDSNTARLTITVEPERGNVSYGNDDANLGLEGQPQMGNLLENDNDPEGDIQSVVEVTDHAGKSLLIDGLTPNFLPGGGTLILENDGTYTYEPIRGFIGTEVLIYKVCDDAIIVGCEQQTLYLTTLPENTTNTTDDFNNTLINTPVTSNVLTNDNDREGDSQTVSLISPVPVAEGTVTLSSNGSFTYFPALGFSGETSFIYEACDDKTPAACEEATVYLEVLKVVDHEVTSIIANPDIVTSEQDQVLDNSVLSNDYDPEGTTIFIKNILADTDGDGISNDYFALGMITPIFGTDENGNTIQAGTLLMKINGEYTYRPALGFLGKVSTSYELTDDNNDVDSTPLTIQVVESEDNNTFAADDAGQTDANIQLNGNVLINDKDPEGDNCPVERLLVDTDGNSLADNPAMVGTPTSVFGYDHYGDLVPAGMLTVQADGTFFFTPATDFVGNVVAVYTICDDAHPQACDNATLDITVNGSFRDYGDAPAMYPEAWHHRLADIDGNNIPDAGSAVWLGKNIDFESETTTSNSADGDSFEEGITFGNGTGQFPGVITRGKTYEVAVTLNGNQSGTEAYLGLWIDWNADGVFEDFQSSAAIVDGSTDVLVEITPPLDFVDGNEAVVRLRVDDDPLTDSDFEGGKTNGEVEDYKHKLIYAEELETFTAIENSCTMYFKWNTNSELNTRHFEVQSSPDGVNFTVVEVIMANGPTLLPQSYSFQYEANRRRTYYRLKTVDLDGSFSLSEVILVETNCSSMEEEVGLFPNPTADELNLAFDAPISAMGTIKIIDGFGRVVMKEDQLVNIGYNKLQLDTKRLEAGVYYINLTFGAQKIRYRKFVKVTE